MTRTRMTCQVKGCGMRFTDMGAYFEHVESHVTEKEVEKEN